jgi:hypothetical protein
MLAQQSAQCDFRAYWGAASPAGDFFPRNKVGMDDSTVLALQFPFKKWVRNQLNDTAWGFRAVG